MWVTARPPRRWRQQRQGYWHRASGWDEQRTFRICKESAMSKLSKVRQKEIEAATRNRRELIAAKLSRRELIKMGLITGAGLLVPKRGLSARSEEHTSELQSP